MNILISSYYRTKSYTTQTEEWGIPFTPERRVNVADFIDIRIKVRKSGETTLEASVVILYIFVNSYKYFHTKRSINQVIN